MPGPISTERMIAARGTRCGDVGQFRARPVVAVLADLVAGQAAGAGDHLLAGLVAAAGPSCRSRSASRRSRRGR